MKFKRMVITGQAPTSVAVYETHSLFTITQFLERNINPCITISRLGLPIIVEWLTEFKEMKMFEKRKSIDITGQRPIVMEFDPGDKGVTITQLQSDARDEKVVISRLGLPIVIEWLQEFSRMTNNDSN